MASSSRKNSQLFDLQIKFMKFSNEVDEIGIKFHDNNNDDDDKEALKNLLVRIKKIDNEYNELVSNVDKSNKPKLILEFKQISIDTRSQIKTLIKDIEKCIEQIPLQESKSNNKNAEQTPSTLIEQKSNNKNAEQTPSTLIEQKSNNDETLRREENSIDSNNYDDNNTNVSIQHGDYSVADHSIANVIDVCSCWFCYRKNPDLIAQDQIEKWRINIKNFFHQYCELSANEFLARFRRSRLHMFIGLSITERQRLIQIMLELLFDHFPYQMDHLIVSIMKIASMLKIDHCNIFIIDSLKQRIESGIYHDVCDYEKMYNKIDEYSETIREKFEMNKKHSLDRYWNNLELIAIMYCKDIIRSNDYVFEISKFLSKNSQLDHCPEIYLDLWIEFLSIIITKLCDQKFRHQPKVKEFFVQIKQQLENNNYEDDERRNKIVELIDNNFIGHDKSRKQNKE
ncbi:uncharacterized protein LOC124497759 [Dermatophagoides farinae]|uniref:uncharacterized protein LOC124497759 n=1 Tax=Dermatophagoides farinae TaxID=6954 RepID=UPI003F6278C5